MSNLDNPQEISSTSEREEFKEEESETEQSIADTEVTSDTELEAETDDYEESFQIVEEKESPGIHEIKYVVPDDQRITSDKLSKFEYTEILCIRTNHISARPIAFCDMTGVTSAKEAAIRELNEGNCPLVVERYRGEREIEGKKYKVYEYWDVNELVNPFANM